ncbi:hypothetical protein ROP_51760 [Rhodococcus opacus B4]|uniref:Uncharacterized protein n=1 Tax=Rhodococcus opacus (strain B4) TaxID=632772 RepID=C1AUT3_RHOOB|nr:hypothetical protein ROP_51760 [Rhodococcus opacus B4]
MRSSPEAIPVAAAYFLSITVMPGSVQDFDAARDHAELPQ